MAGRPSGGDAGSGGAFGALTLFANVAEGDELHLLGETPESLTARAARTVALAMERRALGDVAGALVIFCGGSMLAMQASMDRVAARIDAALCGGPFLGVTFGKKGRSLTCGKSHGNLMISAVVFGKG